LDLRNRHLQENGENCVNETLRCLHCYLISLLVRILQDVLNKGWRNGVLKVNYIPKTVWHIALQKSALFPSSGERNELIWLTTQNEPGD